MTADPSPHALAEAFWQAITSTEMDRYLARGRSLAALDLEALGERFVAVYKAWAAAPTTYDLAHVEDVECEFKLRNLLPPCERILPELAILIPLIKRLAEDPRMTEQIEQQYGHIARALLDPKAKQ